MTAVVGILNKQAVAMAADSAVTIGNGNGRKILNKANKVFTLSKYHPVGIMIYNAASFMGTPWETIIKVYRQQLGNKSFPTLEDYQKNFIEFLRAKSFFTDEQTQKNYLGLFAAEIIQMVLGEILKKNPGLSPDDTGDLYNLLDVEFSGLLARWKKPEAICSEFSDYELATFDSYATDILKQVRKEVLIDIGLKVPNALFKKMTQTIFYLLKSQEKLHSYTGLIFCGFGEDEIYPRLIPLNISMVLNDRLRYFVTEESAIISNDMNAAVRPFAQTDVIDTILSGIDPSLDDYYLKHFDEMLKKYNQAILGSIGTSDLLLSEKIKNLKTEPIVREFFRMNQRIKSQNYIQPLMSAVGTLSKEDLAEMAESLIYLTYLKRRITFAEESVGGPVDVAIISKGDGFIWIKRKHYFKPELNQHFISNYFNI